MHCQKGFSLKEIAELTGATLHGDPTYQISNYAEIATATPSDITFLSNPRFTKTRYTTLLESTRAGAIFLAPNTSPPKHLNVLVAEDPSWAFQTVVIAFQEGKEKKTFFEGIHPSATIHPSAKVADGVTIGPHAVIDGEVTIQSGTTIGAGTSIGPYTIIGKDCVIYPNVTIREACVLKDRITIQSGSVIGSCGFGFSTNTQGQHTRIQQLGSVIIEDDVEIGSNCVIDRARFTETRVGKGTKIDSLVIIGHNVKLGEHNLICGQTAIAGSTQTGRYVVLGGQSGVDGHLVLEDGVMVTGKSGVTKSLPAGKYGGYPAQELKQHNRTSVLIKNLPQIVEQQKALEKRLTSLEEK